MNYNIHMDKIYLNDALIHHVVSIDDLDNPLLNYMRMMYETIDDYYDWILLMYHHLI